MNIDKNMETRREDEIVTMESGLVYHKINKQKKAQGKKSENSRQTNDDA